MFISLFFLFAIGLIIGLIPPFIWGKIGGDEPLIAKYPEWTTVIKFIHHWWIGIIIVFIGLLILEPYNVIVFGWGASTAMDDIIFHSHESFFLRKNGYEKI